MKTQIRENTDTWRIDVIGGGVAYAVTRKTDMKEFFLQGDDASQFARELDNIESLHISAATKFFDMTWNQCIAYICNPYLESI
jgi:hypothetical protein